MARPTAPVGIQRKQRTALIILVVAGTLNYLDRSTLSVANPLIRQELGLSIADMGYCCQRFCGPTLLRNCRPAHSLTGWVRIACSRLA
jgi:hypothetical protein